MDQIQKKKTRSCIVPTCAGRRYELVHKFPRDDPRAEVWRERINNPILFTHSLQEIRKKWFVCGRHFRPNDYINPVSHNINKTAIPSLFLRENESESDTRMDIAADVVEDRLMGNNVVMLNNIHGRKQQDKNRIQVLNETTLLLDSKEFNMTWLRDQCECEYCFDPEEKIKLFHIFSVSHKVSEEYDISLTGNQLKVMWTDDHLSDYDIDNLKGRMLKKHSSADDEELFLWNNLLISNVNKPIVTYAQLICSDSIRQSSILNLHKYGFLIIQNVTNQMNGKIAITQLFPTDKDNYFEWNVIKQRSTMELLGSAIGNKKTFLPDASGIEIIYLPPKATEGNGIILVDGFYVADELKSLVNHTYQTLRTLNVSTAGYENGVRYRLNEPIIQQSTDKIERIRFNLFERDIVNEDPVTYYNCLKEFSEKIDDSKTHYRLNLQPSSLLLIDNWRILSQLSLTEEEYSAKQAFISHDLYKNIIASIK